MENPVTLKLVAKDEPDRAKLLLQMEQLSKLKYQIQSYRLMQGEVARPHWKEIALGSETLVVDIAGPVIAMHANKLDGRAAFDAVYTAMTKDLKLDEAESEAKAQA